VKKHDHVPLLKIIPARKIVAQASVDDLKLKFKRK